MEQKRCEYIDTLRLGAILFIVFAHFDGECFQYLMGSSLVQSYFSESGKMGWLAYGWTGKYALAMLCVISGFLVAMKYAGQKECDVGRFLVTRYFRLMLPVMAANLFFGIWYQWIGESVDIRSFFKTAVIPGLNGVNRNLWCIGSFLLGNVLICLIYYLRRENKVLTVLYIPVLVSAFLLQETWLFATVAGGLCFEAAQWLKERKILNNWWLLIALPILWWLPRGEESTIVYYRDILASVFVIILFYCLPVLQKIFSLHFLKPLKQCCYSLFVVHGMTLFLLGPCWKLVQSWGISGYGEIFVSLFAMTFFIDLAIAYMIYYLFEVRLYRMIVRWLLPDKQAQGSSVHTGDAA